MIRFLIGVSFCSVLVWFINSTLEPYFLDSPWVGIFIAVTVSSIIWNFIYGIYLKVQEYIQKINDKSKRIDLMLQTGMSVSEIVEVLNSEKQVNEEPLKEVITSKIKYDPISSEPCGFYNGVPIYERIKLQNGRTAVFIGVHDMDKKINPSMIKEYTFILDNGIIYSLEKQDA